MLRMGKLFEFGLSTRKCKINCCSSNLARTNSTSTSCTSGFWKLPVSHVEQPLTEPNNANKTNNAGVFYIVAK